MCPPHSNTARVTLLHLQPPRTDEVRVVVAVLAGGVVDGVVAAAAAQELEEEVVEVEVVGIAWPVSKRRG